jgi:F-type H+-transporting ATPase subunit delta
MPIAVANRYARALADVVGRTGDYRASLEELKGFGGVYQESAELREVFDSPAISLAEKSKVLEAILARLRVASSTSNFLRVLLSNYRMGLLREIIQSFRKIANARLGIVEVKVFSAQNLSEREQQDLRRRFGELTRQQVELDFHIDQNLLGGIRAQIGSTVYDGSVRGQLTLMDKQLMGSYLGQA